MIDKRVWVVTGYRMGQQGKVIADNNQGEYLINFGGSCRLQLSTGTIVFKNTCWILHKNIETIE